MTAARRRDRLGELVDVDDDRDLDDGHTCRRGWVDRDHAVPCATCRPWLTRRPARPPTTDGLAAFHTRWPSTVPPRRRRPAKAGAR